MKFKDDKGWIRTLVCGAVLMTHYGIRDAMLTALPTIAIYNSTESTSFINIKNYFENNETTKTQFEQYKELKLENSRDLQSSPILDKNKELKFNGLPLSAFWDKVSGRRALLLSEKLQEKDEEEREKGFNTYSGKYRSLFPGAFEVKEGKISPKMWDYAQTRNEWEKDDEKKSPMRDSSLIPLSIQEGNDKKEDWSLLIEGLVLSSVYWGWLLTALCSNFIIRKIGVQRTMALSMGVAAILSLLTHAMSLGGPWVILPFRIILGGAQGVCYPAITRVLQGLPESSKVFAGLVVFLGPFVGTCVGVGLGSLESWYAATYLMGSLAIPLIPLCLMLPETKKEDTEEKCVPLGDLLKSSGFWTCLVVYISNIFTFHLVLAGLPFCLTFSEIDKPSMKFTVLFVVLVVAFTHKGLMALPPVIEGKGPLTVLHRRRLPVVTGSVLMIIGLIVMATAGLNSFGLLVGFGVGSVGLGVGLTRFGCRLNLEDLAPWTLTRLLHVINIAGVFTAIWPPLLVSGLVQVSESLWLAVWLIPLVFVFPSAVVFVFFLTTNPQSWDEGPENIKKTVTTNGLGPPRGTPVRLSFKSARSGISFKSALSSSQTFRTAASRMRSRTLSLRTVDEELSVDMHSVVEEDTDGEIYSIEGSNIDCKSVASSNSFKSDGADMHSINLEDDPPPQGDLPGRPPTELPTSDRTSAWLNHHHQVPIERASRPTPTKDETRRRNAIYDLFW